jgi:hypothetical protein
MSDERWVIINDWSWVVSNEWLQIPLNQKRAEPLLVLLLKNYNALCRLQTDHSTDSKSKLSIWTHKIRKNGIRHQLEVRITKPDTLNIHSILFAMPIHVQLTKKPYICPGFSMRPVGNGTPGYLESLCSVMWLWSLLQVDDVYRFSWSCASELTTWTLNQLSGPFVASTAHNNSLEGVQEVVQPSSDWVVQLSSNEAPTTEIIPAEVVHGDLMSDECMRGSCV